MKKNTNKKLDKKRVPTNSVEIEVDSVEDLYNCLKKGISFVAFKLKRVDLSSRKLTDSECELLAQVLRSNRSIKSLNLSKSTIRDAGFMALCSALKTNTTLKTLIFASNLINPSSYSHMGQVLKVNTTLTGLSLASYAVASSMGKDGVQFICDGLERNTTLQRLWVGGNQLGNAGVQLLVKTLTKNYTLTELSLQNNSISPQGFNAIGSLFAYQRLKALDLGSNYFNGSCVEFSQSLAVSTSLTALNLKQCDMTTAGLKQLCEGLKANHSIVSLDISHNQFGPEAAPYLADLVKVKPFSELNLRDIFAEGTLPSTEFYEALKIAQIQALNLGANRHPGQAESVAEILKHNTTLQDLKIDSIPLNSGCENVFKALQYNTTLMRLSMMHAGMTETTFEASMNYLKDNQSLTKLDLGHVDAANVLSRVVENLADNYALTNLTSFTGCKLLSKWTKRNRQYQKEVRLKTMLVIYNIARSADAFMIFPAEVWFLILKFVRYPGIGGFDLIAREIFANPFKVIVRAKRDDKIAIEKEMQ